MMYWYQWYTLYLQETNSTNDTRIILTGLKGDSDYTIYVIKFFSSMHDHANVFGWGCSIYLKVTITCQYFFLRICLKKHTLRILNLANYTWIRNGRGSKIQQWV